uniref:Uncharacterized protein n=1 Tax=Tanacetum cinerariifolium TaxID=118510 RepID=A0A6L2J2X5_TANCI|nr:hypothetical protein [Tanacetum cinerariifolium]
MGHGSAPIEDNYAVENDSPIEEVAPVKAKKCGNIVDITFFCDYKEFCGFLGKNKYSLFALFDHMIQNKRNESRSCNLTVFQKALAKYEAHYDYAFTLEANKAKTSTTTLGSTQGGLNLNDKADDHGEEIRKVRPTGHDRAKKKAYSSSRSEYSSVVGGGLVDLVSDK